MKKNLCMLLALCLLTTGLPAALSEVSDEELTIAEDPAIESCVPELGDGLLEAPSGTQALVDGGSGV